VIHWQAIIHSVIRARVHHPGKPMAPLHHPQMTDIRSLGQAGGPRGIDIESPIRDRRRLIIQVLQPVAGEAVDFLVDPPEAVAVLTVRPTLHSWINLREHDS